MSDSLNVIALISGGKDSFYSMLHCMQNGHKIIALGNLYPQPKDVSRMEGSDIVSDLDYGPRASSAESVDEQELNSFMYQTVGHTIIPMYEQALGIPLYRQQILGTAVNTKLDYHNAATRPTNSPSEDETESLVPLLQAIMTAHPEANALSTGAILSTYQRTRVESVATRLGLVPLSYLWQYPFLPPGTQISLLQDMRAAGLDARIIKVASGGLDESFIWENVASPKTISRLERATKRFGTNDDGAVLGEGGEFETLAIDGPSQLFRGRIVVAESQRRLVREGGGSGWLVFKGAKVQMKQETPQLDGGNARTPDLFDHPFTRTLQLLANAEIAAQLDTTSPATRQVSGASIPLSENFSSCVDKSGNLKHRWTTVARQEVIGGPITQEMKDIMRQIRQLLGKQSLQPTDIISTIIGLRDMADFGRVNELYGSLFTEPNPPARVTIACGDALPGACNVIIHWTVDAKPEHVKWKRGLHVQSRSYWAPANIGPYSQAQAISHASNNEDEESALVTVQIAGQIPLVPASMVLPSFEDMPTSLDISHNVDAHSQILLQTVLSLQHLWRIGLEMNVIWWSSAVAYLRHDTLDKVAIRARIAGLAWSYQHRKPPSDEAEDADSSSERDLWEERHHGGLENRGGLERVRTLPDWSAVEETGIDAVDLAPPFFAAEVIELPRGSTVEWHAHLGIAKGPIQLSSSCQEGLGSNYDCTVGNVIRYTTLTIAFQADIKDFTQRIAAILVHSTKSNYPVATDEAGFHGAYLSYVDVNVKGLWESDDYSGVIPCQSLWDGEGKRLAAVLLFETSIERATTLP